MPEYSIQNAGRGHPQTQYVPIVAFYSVSGGVGKSTLAQKFAQLVTQAPGQNNRKPNVLLIDLDVESSGLTFRLTQGTLRRGDRTVHEVIAERNINGIHAMTLPNSIGGQQGQLFLMPAAPPEAKGLFDTIGSIPKNELRELLSNMIEMLVTYHDISCVVIDCAPGANPYTAAAASLADIPLLIGRNETTTYEQIRVLPDRFREYYGEFQPAIQQVIINSVLAKDLFKIKAEKYTTILDYVPLTTAIILETEGIPANKFRIMLFDKYITDIIRKVFARQDYLIPQSADIVGIEWLEILHKLEQCENAPKLKQYWNFRYLRWIGLSMIILGIIFAEGNKIYNIFPEILINSGWWFVGVGTVLTTVGWYVVSEYQRILSVARKLVLGGPENIISQLDTPSHRNELEEMRKFAETISTD